MSKTKKKKKKSKKNKDFLRLNADERPLFAPVHSVHETKKDKENKRATRKKRVREELNSL